MEQYVDISEILRLELNDAIVKQIKLNPSTRVLNIDQVSINDIQNYLARTNAILWGNWIIKGEITDDDDESTGDKTRKAALWLRNVLDELYVYISNKQG